MRFLHTWTAPGVQLCLYPVAQIPQVDLRGGGLRSGGGDVVVHSQSLFHLVSGRSRLHPADLGRHGPLARRLRRPQPVARTVVHEPVLRLGLQPPPDVVGFGAAAAAGAGRSRWFPIGARSVHVRVPLRAGADFVALEVRARLRVSVTVSIQRINPPT